MVSSVAASRHDLHGLCPRRTDVSGDVPKHAWPDSEERVQHGRGELAKLPGRGLLPYGLHGHECPHGHACGTSEQWHGPHCRLYGSSGQHHYEPRLLGAFVLCSKWVICVDRIVLEVHCGMSHHQLRTMSMPMNAAPSKSDGSAWSSQQMAWSDYGWCNWSTESEHSETIPETKPKDDLLKLSLDRRSQ